MFPYLPLLAAESKNRSKCAMVHFTLKSQLAKRDRASFCTDEHRGHDYSKFPDVPQKTSLLHRMETLHSSVQP